MKLRCDCGYNVPLKIIGGQYQHTYEGTCPYKNCRKMWQVKDALAEVDEELEIGEKGVPTECEDGDCTDCGLPERVKRKLDCPHK